MEYREYGREGQKTVMLLHGGGLSWWNYREAAEELQEDYHVILPVLDGHAGSGRPFTGIGDNAGELLSFIDSRLGGRVFLLGGLSLGGQILLEMISRRKDVCEHALAESAMVIPSALIHALIGPSLLCSYGLVRNRHFARLQFRSLHMKEELFGDYYRDTCGITRQDMTAILRANTAFTLPDSAGATNAKVHVFAGGKENRGILRSAERIHEKIPGSTMAVLPGLYHGEFSMKRAGEYAQYIRQLDTPAPKEP